MKIFTLLFLILSASLVAQVNVGGTITDAKGNPIPGANIFIEGSYDGATSAEDGTFNFTTSETGVKTLTVSFLSYETQQISIDLGNVQPITVKLRESVNTLDAVVINAGSLEAGDKARNSVLKPLDIVTTAGSAGNIIAALQTLPGTQNVGEDGRLFVRGGEADETQTFVDGLRVAQPYNATTNNLPTRGRFSPFLFSGIAFSTGGYSAEYSEALSSVLLLNTQDEPDQDKTDLSFMTVGLGVGHTKKWEKSSVSANVAYIDLAPYQALIPQNVDWNRPYQSGSGEVVYRRKFENGLLKLYAAFDASHFDINQDSIGAVRPTRINLKNNNLYVNTSYRANLGSNWDFFTGFGYGLAKNDIRIESDRVENEENAAHFKARVQKKFSDRFKLSMGGDYFLTHFNETYQFERGLVLGTDYKSGIAAGYAEADIFFSKNLALKAGVRASQNDLLDEGSISPRIALAYKIPKRGQFSFAYGEFSQSPNQGYLKFSKFHQFDNEHATHYILNYQYTRDKQTLRAEFYYKKYRDLVRYDSQTASYDSFYSNDGFGYAKGIDLFWRDGRSIRNLEYWVSYSYIDTKRLYRNFPVEATPSFVSDHTLSVVTKYWVEKWRSQISLTNSTSSGRPYENPNLPGYLESKTKMYNSLSLSWAYLLSQQKILYFSMSNVLGTQNVFGYEYSRRPDANGIYQGREITPTADRFFFIGFFWTISSDKKSNQLNNL
ncbi:TonB-dependent receptor [Flavobacterium silvaticum]|uniref:TonB-dependent receptor n=1 Tax=Flavobacterium silvaticum TaxID=1852020 RepID=A0A972G2G1_9FLAO|nr:TonB-dependent receptor [Flavobacterium silvaticum]NMH29241.1 TonB-dependent receptor [Flavobacterium silvaticum]